MYNFIDSKLNGWLEIYVNMKCMQKEEFSYAHNNFQDSSKNERRKNERKKKIIKDQIDNNIMTVI